ncbi:DUF5926 family protein [Williamsia sp. CHRR-6]|uniref:DUF5926 family protein n=1 Tax=Williamsia sp. CHRR-6 TaxID=2835871 RepID=UPI001BDA43F0|nr:DUF5926 family protein [Williamsia sp. CHRR-6]MBT0567628.1 hypothetical protein [Williamsia sp. CHRR-6]
MAKKSKRGSGPRPGSNRAERVAARKLRQAQSAAPAARPFDGLAAECDLVALRAFVASATVAITPAGDGVGTNAVSLATILPGAVQALTRENGDVVEGLVALQTEFNAADVPGEIAAALRWASNAAAGAPYTQQTDDDVLDTSSGTDDLVATVGADTVLDITTHEDFSWWFAPGAQLSPEIEAMVAQASESIMPTARLQADLGGAPWWVDAGERAHIRWVRGESEDDVMTALARLHAAGKLTMGDGSRFAGSFRTHGLLVPVFDLDNERHHEEWVGPAQRFEADLLEALAQTGELTAEQRRSRDGIRSRQVTLR